MEWISVKTKLPTDENNCCSHDYVLVCSMNGACPTYTVGLAQMYDNKWEIVGEVGVFSCDGEYGIEHKDITHWMPLPSRPEKDK